MIVSNIVFSVTASIFILSSPAASEKKVIGKLVAEVNSTVNCGVIKVGVVNKFIITDDRGQSTGDTIKVVCLCPEGYGKDFFKAGNLYSLDITDNLNPLKDCYLIDKYLDEKLPQWLLRGIEKYR